MDYNADVVTGKRIKEHENYTRWGVVAVEKCPPSTGVINLAILSTVHLRFSI